MTRHARISIVLMAALLMSRCSHSSTEPSSSMVSCGYESAIQPSHCGCAISVPVDLANASLLQLWPFGVHATTGHTEGHRGLDLIATSGAVPVLSPVDGTVFSIDNSQDSSGTMVLEYGNNPSVRFTTINADCGLQVKFVPLLLDAGITGGMRVTRGQRLGTLAQLVPLYGSRWSTHFEIDAKTSATDPALTAVCPADFFSDAEKSTLNAILSNSVYDEKSARTVNIACDTGPPLTISYPAENQLCNPRLDAAAHAQLAGCIRSKASQIW